MAQITTTTPTLVGGFVIPWDQIRHLLPDERWAVWGAGWVLSTAVGVTLQVTYQKDDTSQVVLGQATVPAGATYRKIEIGPYAARGDLAPNVPGENLPCINLSAALAAAGTAATLKRWSLWLRMTPRNV